MISKNIRIQSRYDLVSAISEKIGQISSHKELESKPHLRRNNRIKSIHSSLKIEANSLSLSEVREVIDGHLVLGDQKEIQEVKNAYKAYEEIEKIEPYSISELKRINVISEKKGIDLRKAFDIYYSSKLAEQISNDSYGIENMDKNGMNDFYNCLCSCMMSSACSYCSPHMNLCFESERKVN